MKQGESEPVHPRRESEPRFVISAGVVRNVDENHIYGSIADRQSGQLQPCVLPREAIKNRDRNVFVPIDSLFYLEQYFTGPGRQPEDVYVEYITLIPEITVASGLDDNKLYQTLRHIGS